MFHSPPLTRGDLMRGSDFLDLEERLWWQVHSIFRNAAKLCALSSVPEILSVEVGYLKSVAASGAPLVRSITVSLSYALTVAELVTRSVTDLDLGSRAVPVSPHIHTHHETHECVYHT